MRATVRSRTGPGTVPGRLLRVRHHVIHADSSRVAPDLWILDGGLLPRGFPGLRVVVVGDVVVFVEELLPRHAYARTANVPAVRAARRAPRLEAGAAARPRKRQRHPAGRREEGEPGLGELQQGDNLETSLKA